MCRNSYVPEFLNVHVNESNKKIYGLKDFFSNSEKLTFEKENVIFLNIFFQFWFILFNCS